MGNQSTSIIFGKVDLWLHKLLSNELGARSMGYSFYLIGSNLETVSYLIIYIQIKWENIKQQFIKIISNEKSEFVILFRQVSN